MSITTLTNNHLTFKGKSFPNSEEWAANVALELLRQTSIWEKSQLNQECLEFLASSYIQDATTNNNIHSLKTSLDIQSQSKFNGLFNAKGVYSLCS